MIIFLYWKCSICIYCSVTCFSQIKISCWMSFQWIIVSSIIPITCVKFYFSTFLVCFRWFLMYSTVNIVIIKYLHTHREKHIYTHCAYIHTHVWLFLWSEFLKTMLIQSCIILSLIIHIFKLSTDIITPWVEYINTNFLTLSAIKP